MIKKYSKKNKDLIVLFFLIIATIIVCLGIVVYIKLTAFDHDIFEVAHIAHIALALMRYSSIIAVALIAIIGIDLLVYAIKNS